LGGRPPGQPHASRSRTTHRHVSVQVRFQSRIFLSGDFVTPRYLFELQQGRGFRTLEAVNTEIYASSGASGARGQLLTLAASPAVSRESRSMTVHNGQNQRVSPTRGRCQAHNIVEVRKDGSNASRNPATTAAVVVGNSPDFHDGFCSLGVRTEIADENADSPNAAARWTNLLDALQKPL
jgi:hypothetical protein